MGRRLNYAEPKQMNAFRLTRREWLLAATAAALAACAPPAPTQSTANSDGAPARGGVLQVPIFNEPLPLNTVLRHEGAATTVMSVLYSQLTRIDPTTKQAAADIATGFEVAQDGLSWVFHLQEKAKEHDEADVSDDAD